MWNGNQQQTYLSSTSTRLDYSNQIPQYLPRQSSDYSDAIISTMPTNNRMMNGSFLSERKSFFFPLLLTVQSNDQWMNLSWMDPAIISLGNKLESTSSSSSPQRSTSTQMSSGNNLVPNRRWTPQSSSSSNQSHLLTNGIYMPYSTPSGIDDGSRS